MVIKIRHIFYSVLVILIIVSITQFARTSNKKEQFKEKNEPIYCVMVTGKDKSRLKFAHIAIDNFNSQSYPNKKLIIINEGNSLNVNHENILEVKIEDRLKKGIKLGDMRNMAFEFIPDNAVWTLWDDDDWRSDNYLNLLYNNLKSNDYLFFTKRLEHNLNTGFTWTMELNTGFVIMFGRKNPECKYDSKDVNEDVTLKKFITSNLKYKIYINDPKIYVRMVHNSNTSVLVNKNKQHIKDTRNNKVYYEYDASKEDIKYVKNIVNKKYNIIH